MMMQVSVLLSVARATGGWGLGGATVFPVNGYAPADVKVRRMIRMMMMMIIIIASQ
jgi:hypothetical protein